MPRGRRGVALYLHPRKPEVRRILPALTAFLRSRGAEPLGLADQAGFLPPGVRTVPMAQLARAARFVLVLGGDGTFLSAARAVCRHGLPLLGIRLGRTGFLTPVEARGFKVPLGAVLKGAFSVDTRSMVEVRVLSRGGRTVGRGLGLNDVTVKQLDSVRVVRLSLELDCERLGDFTADGLVVATPTGATGYSLSAGGPVVMPGAKVLLATLISPHTLSSRPIVFAPDQVLDIRVDHGEHMLRVAVDGQEFLPVGRGERLAVTGSRHVTRVIRPPGFSYPEVLRSKLGWKA